MNTRRGFVRQVALGTAAGAGLLAGIGVLSYRPVSDIAELTLDRIAPFLNARFRVQHATGALPLELIEARALSRHRAGAGERFSLLFRGPADQPLAQQTCRLVHPEAGEFELFLVPVVAPGGRELQYEAVINREAAV